MTEPVDTDIVVIGAGMVGVSFAAALLRNAPDIRLTLVEPSPITEDGEPYQPSFDTRSTVLSTGTTDWFNELGLWQDMQLHATAIKKIHVSDQGRFGVTELDCSETGVDAFGYVVENPWLGRVLNKHLLDLGQATVMDNCKVLSLKSLADRAEVTVENAQGGQNVISTRLVIMADGGRSGLTEQLGIWRERIPYEQVAVIANVVTEKPHHHQAWERFTGKGPLAMLPLARQNRQNRVALVWTHGEADGDSVMKLTDHEFLERLQKDFGYRLGRLLSVGKRQCYPLSLTTAKEQIRPGLVLLGNAAHTLHPVAGQGFNLAFRDCLELAAVIQEAMSVGKNPGSIDVLDQYQQRIGRDQLTTIGFSDRLTRLFSRPGPVSRLVRKTAILGTDLFPGVKTQLTRQAMGMAGRKVSL